MGRALALHVYIFRRRMRFAFYEAGRKMLIASPSRQRGASATYLTLSGLGEDIFLPHIFLKCPNILKYFVVLHV